MREEPDPVRVLVTVGTDFHPFQRLIDWADRWAQTHPDHHVLVQHGSTSPPRVAEGVRFFSPHELHQEMQSADVVVTHGGPATITEVRRRGKVPVCVPRDPARGEHVDDHQLRFARFLGHRGLVTLVGSESEFQEALCLDGRGGRLDDDAAGSAELPPGVVSVGQIVARLIEDHRARRGARRRSW